MNLVLGKPTQSFRMPNHGSTSRRLPKKKHYLKNPNNFDMQQDSIMSMGSTNQQNHMSLPEANTPALKAKQQKMYDL